jgi:uncharacterized phiE125 gp8 family phage protein
MNLKVLLQPAAEPVTLSEVKTYLRVDGTEEDSTIAGLISASREYIERSTRRTMIYTAYRLTLDKFPGWEDLELPRSPAQELAANTLVGIAYATPRIRYWDMDGNQITMVEGDTYELLLSDNPPRIVLPPTELWPITMAYQRGAVEVDFIAGYGEAAGSVPPMLRQAVKILAAHWYEHREAVGNFGGEVPLSIENIIRLYSDGGYN